MIPLLPVAAIVIGLVGVVVLLRPTGDGLLSLSALAVVASAAATASAISEQASTLRKSSTRCAVCRASPVWPWAAK